MASRSSYAFKSPRKDIKSTPRGRRVLGSLVTPRYNPDEVEESYQPHAAVDIQATPRVSATGVMLFPLDFRRKKTDVCSCLLYAERIHCCEFLLRDR